MIVARISKVKCPRNIKHLGISCLFPHRLQDRLLFHQEMGKKIVKWEEFSSHMRELMENCRMKLQVLRSKGDPKVRKDVDEQMILADVS